METIAALDSILAMFAKCTRLLREAGMPEGFYQRIIDDKDFRLWLVKTCQEKPRPVVPSIPEPTVEKIDVKIDGRSFEQLVAAGKYGKDCVSGNMTSTNFLMGEIPAGKELVRFCLHRTVRGKDEIVAARAALGLEAVTSPAYILTVGAEKPDLQKEGPIVDIDSAWSGPDGSVHCPCLWFSDRKRRLGLGWIDDRFVDYYWFLALRNIQPQP